MRNNSNTKKQILELAENLIMSRGYNGFSYKDISSKLDIKNAAIHYHFPTKKELGVAVIRRSASRFRQFDEMVTNQEISPVDMLNMSFDANLNFLNSNKYVCLGGSLEPDYFTLPEEMQKEIKRFASAVLRWMRNLLSSGREKGLFAFSGSSEDKAFFVLSSMQGAIQIGRVTDKDLFMRLLDKIKNEIIV